MTLQKQQLQRFVTDFFNHQMPFNQLLGLCVSQLDNFQAEIQLDWQQAANALEPSGN